MGMNDKFLELMKAMAELSEMWMITYNSFIGQGLDKKEALYHTQAMMQTMMIVNFGNRGDEK